MASGVSNTKAIMDYFGRGDNLTSGAEGKKVTMEEMKKLSPAERAELGALAAKELGVEIQAG